MESVYQYLMNDLRIKYGDVVVIGVSGGPDSMALLSVLIRIKKAIDIEVVCACINHNTGRAGQKEEQEFVQKYCKNNGIIFEGMTIENYGDDNFHNEAHTKRYNYYNELIKKYNAKYLFTAHHGDDLMETILMRIVRGSTLKGYSGFSKIIKGKNYITVRPLIHMTKDEIIKYDKENKIPYMIDSSNDKDVYTRNRFRKYIVSQIKKEDKNVHNKFYKFSKTLLEYNDYIDKQVLKIIPKVYPQNIINVEEFKKLDHIIAIKVIYYILEKIYQDDLMLITDQHVNLIYELIYNDKPNTYIYLPNHLKAIKSYNNVTLIQEEEKETEYEIEIIDSLNLPNGKNIMKIDESKENGNDICRLDSSEVKLPLRVRTRQAGDKIHIKGMINSKKINDVFIDEKIPMQDRNLWPIVVDSNNEVVWLPGLKKTKFDKQIKEKCDIILKYY